MRVGISGNGRKAVMIARASQPSKGMPATCTYHGVSIWGALLCVITDAPSVRDEANLDPRLAEKSSLLGLGGASSITAGGCWVMKGHWQGAASERVFVRGLLATSSVHGSSMSRTGCCDPSAAHG